MKQMRSEARRTKEIIWKSPESNRKRWKENTEGDYKKGILIKAWEYCAGRRPEGDQIKLKEIRSLPNEMEEGEPKEIGNNEPTKDMEIGSLQPKGDGKRIKGEHKKIEQDNERSPFFS